MKFTIDIPDTHVKGIKAYLKEVANMEKVTKADVRNELESIVWSALESNYEAVNDYIRIEVKKSKPFVNEYE